MRSAPRRRARNLSRAFFGQRANAHSDDLNTVEFRLYNVIGVEVMHEKISSISSTIETGHLKSGVYIYRVTGNGKVMQTGKLVAM